MAMNSQQLHDLQEIRLASKRGRPLTPEQMKFCEEMLRKDPRGYREMDAKVQEIIANDFRFR